MTALFSEKLSVQYKRYSSNAACPLKAYPEGFCGRIAGRPGVDNQHGIYGFSDTIDADYRGVVCIVLFNFSDERYEIMKGNRIAGIIIEKCYDVKFIDYDHDYLPETERSTREFGFSLS